MPRASVIVPTCNRAINLQAALSTLFTQLFPSTEHEILVVDNGSTDNTRVIVEDAIRSFGERRIRYIYEPEPGLLSARHRGALDADSDLLVFVDDDIAATPGWLRAIVETFEDSSVHLVGGRNLPRFEVDPPRWLESFWSTTPYGGRSCAWLSLLDLGDDLREIDANYIWGLNFAIRRFSLFQLGGFHPDCVPDYLQTFQGDGETGLTIKANAKRCKAIYQPDALIFHMIPACRMTPEYFERRAYFQGVCDSYTFVRRFGRPISPAAARLFLSSLNQLRGLVWRAKSYGKSVVDRYASKVHGTKRPVKPICDAEAALIRERVRHAYSAGYVFHQKAIRDNPELLSWVLRPNYWDYRLPCCCPK